MSLCFVFHLLQIEPQFAAAEQKNKLLRSVAGGGMEELSQLRTRWDKFEIMMESHQMMIKDQVCQRHLSISYSYPLPLFPTFPLLCLLTTDAGDVL